MKKTQPLYLDGKLIGEIPCTGDTKKDIQNAQDLFKSKGLSKKDEEADSMFQQAASFAKLALEIYDTKLAKVPPEFSYAAPFVVNATFSIEVYIKSLHSLSGSNKWGHLIGDLYNALNEDVKSTSIIIANRLYSKYHLDSNIKIEALLIEINNAFVNWRYLYEKPPGIVNFSAVCFIIEVLHEVFQTIKNRTRDK